MIYLKQEANVEVILIMKYHSVALFLLLPGCVTTQQCHLSPSTQSTSDVARNATGVYVFMIHGLDPLDLADLKGLRQTIASWGYLPPRLVQFYQGKTVVREIVRLQAEQPEARFLIFGYSAGAQTTSWVINQLHDHHGIDVNTVVYAAGITLVDVERSRPAYIGKIIHIRDGGRIIPGMELTGAENYRFTDVKHYGSPTHPNTLTILKDELHRLSSASNVD